MGTIGTDVKGTAALSAYESFGRVDQKRRTREPIKAAAARLASHGAIPTMADVADAASLSRSSAYRYFPSVEALIAEVAARRDGRARHRGHRHRRRPRRNRPGKVDRGGQSGPRGRHPPRRRVSRGDPNNARRRGSPRPNAALGPATGSATSRPPSPHSTNGCSRSSANDWSPHWR